MQKKLSMFQIILLAIFGALAVAGMLIFALATAGGSNTGVGPVTVWGTLDATEMQTVIRKAAETDPRLSSVTYVQKDAATYQSDLASALASGSGPDVFIITQDWAAKDSTLAYQIPYSSLPKDQFTNTFVQSAAPFLGTDGVIAIPMLADPLVLYWDRDMVASAGFAQPIRYWDELQTQTLKITQKDETGAIQKSAIALGEYQNVDNAKDILATLIMQAGSPITTYDTSGRLISALASRGGVAGAAQAALDEFTMFSNPSQQVYTWSQAQPDARQAFAAQQLAYYIGYASEEPLIKQMNPNLNFAVSGMPQIRSQASTASIDFAHVYGLAVSRQSQNQAGALTVAYLLASNTISDQLSIVYGIPSARLDVLAQGAQGDQDLFNKMAIISRAWVDPDPSQTDPIFQTMIDNTTSGSDTSASAVLHADQSLTHILGL